jgi:hypothetical protein
MWICLGVSPMQSQPHNKSECKNYYKKQIKKILWDLNGEILYIPSLVKITPKRIISHKTITVQNYCDNFF